MDGFAEVSATNGRFLEAVWSDVIHTDLGPLSPNTVLLLIPSFLSIDEESLTKDGRWNQRQYEAIYCT